MDSLKASVFQYKEESYECEFEHILRGITCCCKMMTADGGFVPPNDENLIRDKLLKEYLKNNEIRNRTQLTGYLFDREVPEDNTTGRTDIKVQTPNTFLNTSAYYIIECKRLDNQNLRGTTGLNAEYVKNGILRFTQGKYSTYCGVNGMIGFVVERMNIAANIDNINDLLENNFPGANTVTGLTSLNVIIDFKYQYYSIHKDMNSKKIKLYHLMFDFSVNMNN
jgi:hypothetical protein